MFIEIFKAGTHTDGNGLSGEFSPARLDSIAANYKKRISENPQNLAPVVIGHPESDEPARGWVKQIFRRGNTLVADAEISDSELIASIKDGRYRNVSIAIDSEMNFIHLGFLGAVNPAVEGLNPVRYSAFSQFSASGDEYIYLSDDSEQLNEKIKQLENEKLIFSKKIADYEKHQTEQELENYVDSISKKNVFFTDEINKSQALKILKIADNLDSIQQNNSENTKIVKDFLDKFTKIPERNKFESLVGNNFSSQSNFGGSIPERNTMHLKALDIINKNPNIKYEDALAISGSNFLNY